MSQVTRRTFLTVPVGLASLAALAGCGASATSPTEQPPSSAPSLSSPTAASSAPTRVATTYDSGFRLRSFAGLPELPPNQDEPRPKAHHRRLAVQRPSA
jgi:hypothetical protein